MATPTSELKTSIEKLERTIKSPSTPSDFLPLLKEKKEKLEADLAALEKVNKEEAAVVKEVATIKKEPATTPQAKEKKAEKLKKVTAKKETVSEKKVHVKKAAKDNVVDAKDFMQKMSDQVAEFNKGRSASSLSNDAKKTANKPGKHKSAEGKIYYEHRPDHTDIEPKNGLAEGGKVKSELTPGLFTITGDKSYPGWHDPNKKWNGFATPVFDKKTAIKILEDSVEYDKNLKKESGHPKDSIFEFKEEKDALFYKQPEFTDEGWVEVKPLNIFVDDKKIVAYPLGSYEWVWEEADNYASGGTIDHKQVKELAIAFSNELRKDISAENMTEINRRNKTPEYVGACATHDFIDANQSMLDVFKPVTGHEFVFYNGDEPETEKQFDADSALWDAAWSLARRNDFDVEKINADENFANGGRLKSALMRDRKYTSQQEWEQKYVRKGGAKHYLENGGDVAEQTAETIWANWSPLERGNFIKRYKEEIKNTSMAEVIEKYVPLSTAAGEAAIYTQYPAGSTPQSVWAAWSKAQRSHFIKDHKTQIAESDMETVLAEHIAGVQYQTGGQIPESDLVIPKPSYFDQGTNITLFGYQTKNFDICPMAVEQFTEARNYITNNIAGKKFEEQSLALVNLAKEVDNIFHLEKIVFEQGFSTEKTIDTVVKGIALCGIFNFTADSLIDLSFLGNHVASIARMHSDQHFLANGGRIKSALMRDRKYLSQQEHEQAYNRLKGSNRKGYSMAYGGMVKKVEKNVEKLLAHYLPDVKEFKEVVEQSDLREEGQYIFDNDYRADEDRTKILILEVCCNESFTEMNKKLDDDYNKFAKFAEDFAKEMKCSVEILTYEREETENRDELKTFSFHFFE